MSEVQKQDLTVDEVAESLREQGWKSPDDIKSDYVTKAYHTERFNKEKQRFEERVAGRKSLDEVLSDEEWTSKILKEKNVVPNQAIETRIEELKTKLAKELEDKYKPVLEENAGIKAKLGSLTQSQLRSKLTQAGASLGLKDEYQTEKGSELLYKIIGSEFGHDDATGQFYKLGQNGFETSTVAGQTYMTVEEHLKSLKKDPAFGALLFKAEGQEGPGVTPKKGAPTAPAAVTATDKIKAGLAARAAK